MTYVAVIVIVILIGWVMVLAGKLSDAEMELGQIHRDEAERERRERGRVHGN